MKKMLIWSLIICILLLISVFYYFIDPEKPGMGMPCTFKAATGLNCVGCGGQRAFHFLLHGDFLKAARYNFLIYLLPFFMYLIYIIVEVYIFKKEKHLAGFMFSNKLGITVLIVAVSFMILRNIPCEPFIYLSPPN
ncbi:MAG: DUF2752 domain-containing protein [Flavobacteriaceae bacterium]|jgi:hypothetical protein|nr:DUF2752 domain-containing protein [Flavobacteriaceae bacterium]